MNLAYLETFAAVGCLAIALAEFLKIKAKRRPMLAVGLLILGGVFFVAALCVPNSENKAQSHNQTATTGGNNSPIIQVGASTGPRSVTLGNASSIGSITTGDTFINNFYHSTNVLRLAVSLNGQKLPEDGHTLFTLPKSREIKLGVSNDGSEMISGFKIRLFLPIPDQFVVVPSGWYKVGRALLKDSRKETGVSIWETKPDVHLTPNSEFEPDPPLSISTNCPIQYFSITKMKEIGFGNDGGPLTNFPPETLFPFFPAMVEVYSDNSDQRICLTLKLP